MSYQCQVTPRSPRRSLPPRIPREKVHTLLPGAGRTRRCASSRFFFCRRRQPATAAALYHLSASDRSRPLSVGANKSAADQARHHCVLLKPIASFPLPSDFSSTTPSKPSIIRFLSQPADPDTAPYPPRRSNKRSYFHLHQPILLLLASSASFQRPWPRRGLPPPWALVGMATLTTSRRLPPSPTAMAFRSGPWA